MGRTTKRGLDLTGVAVATGRSVARFGMPHGNVGDAAPGGDPGPDLRRPAREQLGDMSATGNADRVNAGFVDGDTSDRSVDSDNTFGNWAGQPTERIGRAASGGLRRNHIMVFELPQLPSGEQVIDADLKVTLVGGNDFGALFQTGVDLYGVRLDASGTVATSDFYAGSYAVSGNNGVGLQENLVYQPNSFNSGFDPALLGDHHTDPTGDANLAAWLQSLYDDPGYNSSGTNYAFLRLSGQGNIGGDFRYFEFGTANNSTAANRPVLQITSGAVIPEPSSLGLIGVAVGLLALRRRRGCPAEA